jgi:hypothetical protein
MVGMAFLQIWDSVPKYTFLRRKNQSWEYARHRKGARLILFAARCFASDASDQLRACFRFAFSPANPHLRERRMYGKLKA